MAKYPSLFDRWSAMCGALSEEEEAVRLNEMTFGRPDSIAFLAIKTRGSTLSVLRKPLVKPATFWPNKGN
ncbi:hypothetical protein V1282_000209 [Nitrobacteraceae bacterium AZCC 2146]